MPGATGATGAEGTEAFARLLLELKDRSGLSYGALAKRMHMSTSTLHRYCNGTAVPVDYAPVERLARVCKATPDELVELHRRWILADAARGNKGEREQPGAAAAAVTGTGAEASEGTAGTGDASLTDASSTAGHTSHHPTHADPVVSDVPRDPAPPLRRRQRRTALVAACVAGVVALGAAVFVVPPLLGGGDGDSGGRRAVAGVTAPGSEAPDDGKVTASPSPSATRPTPSPSASPTAARSRAPKDDGGAAPRDDDRGTAAVPLTVGTRPYVYDSPCSQHFLVDSEPEQVGPPAGEQDAVRWAAAYGAVSSDEQEIALTVQGTGEDTVVLEALHVRVLSKGAPLAWNDYSMGVGCGGGVGTKVFDIDLDDGSPTVGVRNGQRPFPYKVSESDPEVFYVTARTAAHDVRWDLTLDWSSGSRRGTVHIDDSGSPFRTSAGTGRPGYDYPLGGGEWIKREGG
ncbi:helix-turn-helix domain-containing protein [Streptomyces longwoodensis]|uniref:helix-turn-helix domain-containing protein n=1 Tax=Streptomyces longwoodensis TaxID=68231 RepID=UPI0030DED5D3|nr:helix-turn-helix domain-containing protein [Streptomyces longwoodensis]